MSASEPKNQSFEPGAEIMFHLASFGASVVPLPKQQAMETGQIAGMELNIMSGIYRDETDTHFIVDVTSVMPPLMGTRLLKSGVDLIGERSKVEAVSRPLRRV